jgi:hypothetical protein
MCKLLVCTLYDLLFVPRNTSTMRVWCALLIETIHHSVHRTLVTLKHAMLVNPRHELHFLAGYSLLSSIVRVEGLSNHGSGNIGFMNEMNTLPQGNGNPSSRRAIVSD